MERLKSLVSAQQKSLEQQQKSLGQQQEQIKKLQNALAQQQAMLLCMAEKSNGQAQYTQAVDRTVHLHAGECNFQTPQASEELTGQQQENQQAEQQTPPKATLATYRTPLPAYSPVAMENPQKTAANPQQEAPPIKFNPTQEVAGEKPEGPAVQAGPAQIRFGGYLGLTGIYRSTNSGNGTGTSFNSIPFSNKGQGNVSESRLTANASRISIRADADFPEGGFAGLDRLSGYFEMDFNGYTSGTNDVTSSSAGFRLRHAFGEAQWDQQKWLFGIGQAFSLMTPQKGEISMWPSDVEMSQAVDTNYLAGMIWGRIPQARITFRPTKAFSWAFSVENPEQQLGKSGVVTLPACCATDIDAQYNTGGDELKVPDYLPDFTTRIAWNTKMFHVDAGGIIRVFRQNIKPYTNDQKQVGGGGNVNFSVKPLKGTKLLVQLAYGAGIGRYIGGLVPDVAFKADGTISPIRTASWVTGVEQKITKQMSLAGYYSGVYAYSTFFNDTDGTFIGYGFPASPDSNNRLISEWTGVFSYQLFKTENRGSVQWNTQFSWLDRNPWARVNGMGYTSANMFFTQMRYNLP